MVNIAIIGHGVVGSGVSETLLSRKDSILRKTAQEINIKYVLDIREFPSLPIKVVHDFETIENDPEVTIVVETMGGVEPAYDYVKRCLQKGKDVVTSNKELVAQKGAELVDIALKNNCNFLFEASVGGGIPILRPLNQCLEVNEFSQISGILNGTTNFILTKMINDGIDFDEALALAQKLGYAERNPAADIDGLDTGRKISILASLAFGKHVYPDSIHTEGIRDLSLIDVQYAESWHGRVVKLLGKVKRKDDGTLAAIVCPMIIRKGSLLSEIDDVYNGVMLTGDLVGDVVLYGKGAGKYPTASAVVADVIDCAKHNERRKAIYWEDSKENLVSDYLDEKTQMYFRVSITDKSDIDKIRDTFKNIKVLSRKGAKWSEFAFVVQEEETEREIIKKITLCGVRINSMIRVESDI